MSPRLVRDVQGLTPSEAILLLERLQISKHTSSLLRKVRDCLEYELLEIPSLTQQEELASIAFLGGAIGVEELVDARLAWLASKGCSIPDRHSAVELFKFVQERIYEILMTCQGDVYAQISSVMQQLLQKGQVDASVDILALCVFFGGDDGALPGALFVDDREAVCSCVAHRGGEALRTDARDPPWLSNHADPHVASPVIVGFLVDRSPGGLPGLR